MYALILILSIEVIHYMLKRPQLSVIKKTSVLLDW